jgi:hypothetical protein
VHRIEDRGEELGPRVAGFGDRDVRRRELGKQLLGQSLFRGPAPVDRGLANARSGSDVLETKVGKPILAQDRPKCVEDRPMDAVASRPAFSGRGPRLGDPRLLPIRSVLLGFDHGAIIRNGSYLCKEIIP